MVLLRAKKIQIIESHFRFLNEGSTLILRILSLLLYFLRHLSQMKYKKIDYECQENVGKFWKRRDQLYKYKRLSILDSTAASIDTL